MESDFYITQDERELIIECLEADIKEKAPHECESVMYREWAKCRAENLRSLIERLRDNF